ncbi:hypothetical protein HIO71_14880 [Chryseobacterium aquaticum]|uniref:Uncharacterized protein n=1 Tax=Chryseobacterium aquaticum TaxID=452084 RepID=A0A848NA87_9FLAO|nr:MULTISPECIES: hypothetical protein [Chryseobacterium]NMR35470.1 hypothetical protein [Chryseobacterium aquaticum]NRQ47546.1 hypothetical protein [Chryseobacterium sp. C-204]
MNYTEFNNWVYNYYLEYLIPNQVNSLTIPKSEIDFLIQSKNLKVNCFREINSESWSYLLGRNSKGIPNFLGLIALQCHAAFIMQNDHITTAANFRDRFIKLTGIKSDIKLNSFFSEEFSNKMNVQEVIWNRVNSFFNEKNIKIALPLKKTHTGRNTQYPLSQSVLNYEDLKEYKSFYEYISREYDVIHYDDFLIEYYQNISRFEFYFHRVNNKKSLSESEQNIKFKQIFDYYIAQQWIQNDGELEKRQRNSSSQVFFLKLNKRVFDVYNEELENTCNINVVFNNKKIVFFQEDEIYRNEFKLVKKISTGSRYIIFLKNITENEYLKKRFEENKFCIKIGDENINITSYLLNFKDEVPEFLKQFEGNNYPIKIVGTKVSRKRQYLVIAPPIIFSQNNESYSLYHNSNRVNNNQPLEIGSYFIKVKGFSNYSFEIIDTPDIKFSLPILDNKLSLQNLEIKDNNFGDMSGFFVINREIEIIADLSIKKWIETNTGKKNKSNNIILKAINQGAYGKNK